MQEQFGAKSSMHKATRVQVEVRGSGLSSQHQSSFLNFSI